MHGGKWRRGIQTIVTSIDWDRGGREVSKILIRVHVAFRVYSTITDKRPFSLKSFSLSAILPFSYANKWVSNKYSHSTEKSALNRTSNYHNCSHLARPALWFSTDNISLSRFLTHSNVRDIVACWFAYNFCSKSKSHMFLLSLVYALCHGN